MKINEYGIKTTNINGCIDVFTIKISFVYDVKIHNLIINSLFANWYTLIIDKNNNQKLLINYGTQNREEFISACKEFEIISINNKINKISNKTSLSKTEFSQILISKVAFDI